MTTYHLTISAPRRSAPRWGDWDYAHGLMAALESLGHRARLHCLHELTADEVCDRDVVLRITGPHIEDPIDGAVNLLWVISNPDPAFPRLLAGYQHIFAAGAPLAEWYAGLGLPASTLRQATDLSRFRPADVPPEDQILFVGGYDRQRVKRLLVMRAVALGYPVSVWGPGWEGHIPDAVHRGRHLEPNELVARYARARIVLNDHMEDQRRTGIISNRTMDALAAGAQVVSDGLPGGAALGLDGLHIVEEEADLAPLLDRLLAAPPDSFDQRMARHHALTAGFSFDAAARQIVAQAQALLRDDRRAWRLPPPTLPPAPTAQPVGARHRVLVCDYPGLGARLLRAGAPAKMLDPRDAGAELPDPGEGWLLAEDPAALDPLGDAADVTLLLTPGDLPPGGPQEASSPAVPLSDAIQRAEALWHQRHPQGMLHPVPVDGAPEPLRAALAQLLAEPPGPLHPMRALKDRCNAALLAGRPEQAAADFTIAATLWRRAWFSRPCLPSPGRGLSADLLMLRIMQGLPIFPTGRLARAPTALCEALRMAPPPGWPDLARPVGVFLHLFYDELAPVFAQRLAEMIRAPYRVHVSTDCDQKAARIASHMPDADIRVFPNRGRDVWPRLWGFRDAHDDYDLVLHLHGKRSPHAQKLEGWLQHNLDALLGDRATVKSILTIFDQAPEVGVIAPPVYPGVMAAAHWTANRVMADMLAAQMGIAALPGNDALVFPVGSMFWARSAALRPLLDLGLRQHDFPPERRQLDGTLAHAVERLVTIAARHAGFDQISYSGQAKPGKNRHHHRFADVAELRDYLRERD